MTLSFVFDIVNMAALAVFLLMAAVSDYRHRIIPNKYIAAFFAVRTLLIVVQAVMTGLFVNAVIRSFVGLAAGFIVTGAAALISKKGLGAGDIKMYALVGYFTGCTDMLDILIYSTFFCALTGLALVTMKKCKMKSFLPMAPFTFAGTMVYILFENI